MDSITNLTVHELVEKLKNNELTSEEITKAYIDRINEKEKDVDAFVTLTTDEALNESKKLDEKRNGENQYCATFSEQNAQAQYPPGYVGIFEV